MTILLVSPDDEARAALSSALTRAGESWRSEPSAVTGLEAAEHKLPLVLVTDAADGGHAALSLALRARAPWTRVFLMSDGGTAAAPGTRVVRKPFDATEAAALLSRERELASLERARLALEAEAHELARLVEASFEAIIGLAPDGTIRSWNRGAETIYGFSEAEVLGRSITMLGAGAWPSPEGRVVEVTRRHREGREVLVLLSLSPLAARGDEPRGFAEVSLDITGRKKLERELEHAERLAAIGKLATTMAHEINNPLAVIRASAAFLAELTGRLGEREATEAVADIQAASARIADFVQHVCGFSRRGRPELSESRVGATLEMALQMIRPRAREAGVRIDLELTGDGAVPHDPPRLSQAIMNLVANAIDAASAGGRQVTLGLRRSAKELCILVEDDGPGFDGATADHLFEPFHTTKPPGQGTGLGLAIARRIVSDHGGRLTLEHRAPQGVRAVIALPLPDFSAHPILVVDDDAAVRRALAGELRRGGFSVLATASFAEAERCLGEHDVRVIVTDLGLRDLSGEPLVAAFRRLAPAARRLVVSGEPDLRPLRDVDRTLSKPWDSGQLLAAVRTLYIAASAPPSSPNATDAPAGY